MALKGLIEGARGHGANGLIHFNFQNRVASEAGCGFAQQVFEVFAWDGYSILSICDHACGRVATVGIHVPSLRMSLHEPHLFVLTFMFAVRDLGVSPIRVLETLAFHIAATS